MLSGEHMACVTSSLEHFNWIECFYEKEYIALLVHDVFLDLKYQPLQWST